MGNDCLDGVGGMESETCICFIMLFSMKSCMDASIFASVNNCDYFKKFLDNQAIKIGEEIKNYNCYCKLVKVNENTRLY